MESRARLLVGWARRKGGGLRRRICPLATAAASCQQQQPKRQAASTSSGVSSWPRQTDASSSGFYRPPPSPSPSASPSSSSSSFFAPPWLSSRKPTRTVLLPPQSQNDRGKLTVVLDLDETLVHSRPSSWLNATTTAQYRSLYTSPSSSAKNMSKNDGCMENQLLRSSMSAPAFLGDNANDRGGQGNESSAGSLDTSRLAIARDGQNKEEEYPGQLLGSEPARTAWEHLPLLPYLVAQAIESVLLSRGLDTVAKLRGMSRRDWGQVAITMNEWIEAIRLADIASMENQRGTASAFLDYDEINMVLPKLESIGIHTVGHLRRRMASSTSGGGSGGVGSLMASSGVVSFSLSEQETIASILDSGFGKDVFSRNVTNIMSNVHFYKPPPPGPPDFHIPKLMMVTWFRPYLKEFLTEMSRLPIEIVVFTAGSKEYADAVVDALDPRGCVRHRLYRDAVEQSGAQAGAKDLMLLGRPLHRVLLIDNAEKSFQTQPDNGVRVLDFHGHQHVDDRELIRVWRLLLDLVREDELSRRNVVVSNGGSTSGTGNDRGGGGSSHDASGGDAKDAKGNHPSVADPSEVEFDVRPRLLKEKIWWTNELAQNPDRWRAFQRTKCEALEAQGFLVNVI